MKARWVGVGMLALAGCGRAVQTPVPVDALAFEEASGPTGLNFRHFTGATGEYYLPEIMSPGVALFDFDGDGDLDVYLVQGAFIDAGKSMQDASFPMPQGWKHGGRLFRNELVPGGTLRFTDVTEGSGIATPFDGMGVAVGDFDNDGAIDLLATGLGRSALFRNLGNGRFRDVTDEVGVRDEQLSTSAAFVDYDRDGWLDLFVAHYVHGTTIERKKCRNPAAELDYCGPQAFPPSVDRLYHNDRGRRFEDVTAASGIGAAAGPGLGVVIGDLNSDGWPVIYVANDGAASFLWLNQQNGTFREAGLELGVAYSADGKAQAGMGVAIGDIDNDGREELFKTNLRREGANLYRRDASGAYGDASSRLNIMSATMPHTGFGVGFADFDNDGWLDAFVSNGAVMAMEAQHGEPYPYRQSNVLLRNRRGTFTPVAPGTGPLAEQTVGRGVAFGDVDNDGDIDFVVANNNGPTRLFLNTLSKRGIDRAHWLRVRLETAAAGRRGFQALMRLETSAGTQIRRIDPSGSYLCASDPSAHFGLGAETRVRSLSVEWADGSHSTHTVEAIDREIQIRQP